MWQRPIYDRTLYDVQIKNSKAYINTADLNRIETNMQHLADVLHCSIDSKNWSDGEFVFNSDMERLRLNLQVLEEAYFVTRKSPKIPTVPFVIYSQWNDIEKILYDIYSLFFANKAAVSFCGEMYLGSQIGVI